MPRRKWVITVDDTHNINTEHKNVEANTEYDPNCCVRNDLDENEIERIDDDIWYATDENNDDGNEPIFYDSGMWAGDASFDHHNETNSIVDEPINASSIEIKFYESRQRSPQRSDVRRDCSIPDIEDFSIESIPSIIPLTDEHELYKGAMFKQG